MALYYKVRSDSRRVCAPRINFIAVSAGTLDRDFQKLVELRKAYPKQLPLICLDIDISNGYSEHFAVFIKRARKEFPEHIIMAGNVVTLEMTEQLLLSGADIVKTGVGYLRTRARVI